jgi:hypothetical protein
LGVWRALCHSRRRARATGFAILSTSPAPPTPAVPQVRSGSDAAPPLPRCHRGLLRTAGAIAIAPRPVEVPPLFGKWSALHAKLAKEKHVTFFGTEIPAQPLIRDKRATAIKNSDRLGYLRESQDLIVLLFNSQSQPLGLRTPDLDAHAVNREADRQRGAEVSRARLAAPV